MAPITAEGEDEVARLAKVLSKHVAVSADSSKKFLRAFPGLLLPVSRDGVIGEHILRSQNY